MKNFTLVLDLDGTLVDTAPDLIRATNHVMRSIGASEAPGEHIRATVSHGARAMIVHALALAGRSLDDAAIDGLLAQFLDYYAANIAVESRPFPDVVDVLTGLARRGTKLAVCTNKREALSRKLLKELRMDRLFSAIVGRDTLPVYKPDPGHLIGTIILADGNLDRAFMVGDSEVDVMTAKRAGIPCIGVTFGYTPSPIASFGPEGLIDHYRDLEARMREILAAQDAMPT
ncbi:MAG: HAD-IA family hydrolase [Hyphomicrobiaceae bacterium]